MSRSMRLRGVPHLGAGSDAKGHFGREGARMAWPRPRRLLAAAVGALLCLQPTAFAGNDTVRPRSPAIERIANLLEQIRARYVEHVDDDKVVTDAINGVLKGLDPYSKYMDPESFQTMQSQNRGEYGGLGVEVRIEPAGARVVTSIDDAPARRAGIRSGDLITRIGDAAVAGLNLEQVTQRMRGKPDSEVSVSFVSPGDPDSRVVMVKRTLVRWQSVRGRLIDGCAYLRITNFQEHTGEMMAGAIEQLWRDSRGHVLGIVLDLRDNPGGLITAAVAVSSAFLPGNVPIAYADGAGQSSKMRLFARKEDYLRANAEDYLAKLPAELKTLPLVVLVNKNSASSSEIVAGAMQDHKRATILGTVTFGKGSIQRMFTQDDGSGLKITTSYYYTPAGRKVHGQGIKPDVTVEKDAPLVTARADDVQPQTVALDSQVAQHEAQPLKPAACSALVRADSAGTEKAPQFADEPDCQLEEALRLLRSRNAVSHS
jgi:carboxyl-terminal processing protease